MDFIRKINGLNDVEIIQKIEKGWSSDTKYYLEKKCGEKLVLRCSDMEKYDIKKREYEILSIVDKKINNISSPIDFGICDGGKQVYSLLKWIEGDTLGDVIQSLSKEKQYKLGIQAGEILKKLHKIKVPFDAKDWYKRMSKKITHHQKVYKESRLYIENQEYAINYIQENMNLLEDRDQTFQHGDYHVGNLINKSNNNLGIIDFNRWSYGDPYEEFYKTMLFSRELSISFAKGQLHGYFGSVIPDDFFPLLKLYLADVILFSVVWSIPFGQKDVDNMIKRSQMIFKDFENFKSEKPIWMK